MINIIYKPVVKLGVSTHVVKKQAENIVRTQE
jgi:hypothetical protein